MSLDRRDDHDVLTAVGVSREVLVESGLQLSEELCQRRDPSAPEEDLQFRHKRDAETDTSCPFHVEPLTAEQSDQVLGRVQSVR